MPLITKEVQFDAGHRVPRHQSKCRNPHGHRYRVVVACIGDIISEEGAPDEGMLIDFGDLKLFMEREIHDVLDHGFIVYNQDKPMLQALNTDIVAGEEPWKVITFPYVPTAENIARWCFGQLESLINDYWRGNLRLAYVGVWETPTSYAEAHSA